MQNEDKNSLQAEQSEACIPEQPVTSEKSAGANCQEEIQQIPRTRKDKNRLHTARHAVLSRYPLEALARLGENVRTLRRIERQFRAELKPSGVTGAILFDRLWSSHLHCLLAARAEANLFATIGQPPGQPRRTSFLKEAELPTLVSEENEMTTGALSIDLQRQMALVARYDRHFAREMYRALAMLLVLRSSGEAGLELCAGHMLGMHNENSGGS